MCNEEKIIKLQKNNLLINELIKENQLLLKELMNCKNEEWEWCSVATASSITEISAPVLYRKIDSGELPVKKLNTKLYVKISDLKKLLGECV